MNKQHNQRPMTAKMNELAHPEVSMNAPQKAGFRYNLLASSMLAILVGLPATAMTDDGAGYTIEVESKGEEAPRTESLSDAALQANRRVDVELSATPVVKPLSGIFWVSEDPARIDPRLDVTASTDIRVDSQGVFEEPAKFRLYSNYSPFIKRWRLEIARADNPRRPVKVFEGDQPSFEESLTWNGETDNGERLRPDDQLVYVLKVFDADNRGDETARREILLGDANSTFERVSDMPDRFKRETEEDGIFGGDIYGETNIAKQTIPIHGSRVRIHGADLNPYYQISLDGEKVTVDKEGKFVVEKLLPIGPHQMELEIIDDHGEVMRRPIDLDVKGEYFFMVGIADVTVGEGKLVGDAVEEGEFNSPLADDAHYDGGTFVDGRLAFYMKAKYRGKYLVTAQLDTEETEINDLFRDLHKADPKSQFRRLDPDRYYPVYGDGSTSYMDTDTQGKFYVRVDWDKNQALWGNYNTGLTEGEYSSFNRGLYGARVEFNSDEVTADNEHKYKIIGFASESETAMAHGEFLGTGGSLYYLKHTDIVIGSEKLAVEVRERTTGRVVERIELLEGRDYEIDEIQGRIILTRPLSQASSSLSGPSIIQFDGNLNGNDIYLVTDYEYVPDGFNGGELTAGVRGQSWLGDHFRIGGTYIDESEAGKSYTLRGIDAILQYQPGTYLKLEYAESEGRQSNDSYLSTDGGITEFVPLDTNPESAEGKAYSIEARADLAEFSELEGTVSAWWKRREAGFSGSRSNSSSGDETTYGVEANIDLNNQTNLRLRADILEKEEQTETERVAAQLEYEASDRLTIAASLEWRNETVITTAESEQELLGALKLGYQVTPDTEVYGIVQTQLSADDDVEENDRLTLGVRSRVSDKLSVEAEGSTGDRGETARAGIEYRRNENSSYYAGYTLSTDREDGQRGILTAGQRSRISDQTEVFQESQFTHGDRESGIGHTFGLNLNPADNWRYAFTLNTSSLTNASGEPVDRDGATVSVSYEPDERLKWMSKIEYRNDTSATEDKRQWLTTNRVDYVIDDEWTFLGRLNASVSKDKISDVNAAKFIEFDLGMAYRPIWNNRLNLLGKYSYLYDLDSEGQSSDPDEKAHIFSVEGIYNFNQRWSMAGKLAYMQREQRVARDTGTWFESRAKLAAARLEYHTVYDWDALAELRWLQTDDPNNDGNETRTGALLAVYKHVGKNLKVGLGYNFTNFDDDLKNIDVDARGWFVNVIGKY